MLLPVERCALLIMPFEGIGVARAFIAEHAAKRLKPMAVGDQSVPVVMPDFVTKMPEQRAIGFVHLHPYLLAVRVVGFLDIEGDQAVGVARGRRLAFKVDTDEIEGKASLFIDCPGNHLQPQTDQLRDQTPLGGFHLAPALVIFGDRQVGNRAIQAAGHAQGFVVIGRQQPVARSR
ncbi:hypothetical protein D3C71_1595360 [compost metagenome]